MWTYVWLIMRLIVRFFLQFYCFEYLHSGWLSSLFVLCMVWPMCTYSTGRLSATSCGWQAVTQHEQEQKIRDNLLVRWCPVRQIDSVKFELEILKTEKSSWFSYFSKIRLWFHQDQFFASATRASVLPNQLNPASTWNYWIGAWPWFSRGTWK